MGLGSGYILLELMLSYLCGISDNSVFLEDDDSEHTPTPELTEELLLVPDFIVPTILLIRVILIHEYSYHTHT